MVLGPHVGEILQTVLGMQLMMSTTVSSRYVEEGPLLPCGIQC